jgi:hypothetical protein
MGVVRKGKGCIGMRKYKHRCIYPGCYYEWESPRIFEMYCPKCGRLQSW